MSDFVHTPETDDCIRSGYRDGVPIRDIARALGLTRNAVIGRARRIGLAATYHPLARRMSISSALKGKPNFAMRNYWASFTKKERRTMTQHMRDALAEVNTAHKNSEEV